MNTVPSTTSTTPAVTYDPQVGLTVTHYVSTDPAVISEIPHWGSGHRGPGVPFEELAGADLGPFLDAALVAGALAIKHAGGTQEAQRLDRLVDDVGNRAAAASSDAARLTAEATHQAAADMTKAAEQAKIAMQEVARLAHADMGRELNETKEELRGVIRRLFEGDDGQDPVVSANLDRVLADFGKNLDAQVASHTADLTRKAVEQFDLRNPASPMSTVSRQWSQQNEALTRQMQAGQNDLTQQIERLSEAVHATTAAAAAVRQTTRVTPLKGVAYEQGLQPVLTSFAGTQGDEYLDTSHETGRVARSKKGDGVLVVSTPAGPVRVVIEATDSDTAPRSWNAYLGEAERNRDACVSLGLVRTVDQLDGERLRVFGPTRFVLAYDPETDDPGLLHALLLLLRVQASAAASRGPGEDLRAVETKIAEALSAVQRLADVQKTAGAIRTAAGRIDTDCAAIQTLLQRLLAEAGGALGCIVTPRTDAA